MESPETYTILLNKIKCPVHYTYKDLLYRPKEVLDKDSLFRACDGHYHTMRNNKTVLICDNRKCVKRQLKYLKMLECDEFFIYCSNPFCQ